MEKNSGKKAGPPDVEQHLSEAALEKYRVLSAKYGNDFYDYAGYVMLDNGKDGWLKLIEGIPLETVDAAVSTWIICGRPRNTEDKDRKQHR